jgi:hypothetical protein
LRASILGTDLVAAHVFGIADALAAIGPASQGRGIATLAAPTEGRQRALGVSEKDLS